jgi:hypothetical protein
VQVITRRLALWLLMFWAPPLSLLLLLCKVPSLKKKKEKRVMDAAVDVTLGVAEVPLKSLQRATVSTPDPFGVL